VCPQDDNNICSLSPVHIILYYIIITIIIIIIIIIINISQDQSVYLFVALVAADNFDRLIAVSHDANTRHVQYPQCVSLGQLQTDLS